MGMIQDKLFVKECAGYDDKDGKGQDWDVTK